MKKDRHPDAHNFITLKTNTMKTDANIVTFVLYNIIFKQKNEKY